MSNKKQTILLRIMLIYILLQPLLDVLSFLGMRGFIVNISTYLKPIFIFSLATYFFIKYNRYNTKLYIYILAFMIFILGHFLVLNNLLTPISMIIKEFRFIINIVYMIAAYICFKTLYHHFNDKDYFLTSIKKTLVVTFGLYFAIILLAIITGTSALTYEYADLLKKGYKGWFDSGQILGHAFSILFPILLYTILRPRQNKIIKILLLSMVVICGSLIGTKVPYFITLIVLILYLLISVFVIVINKDFNKNIFNMILVSLAIVTMIVTYKYTPVAYNLAINNSNAQIDITEYDINQINESANILTNEEIAQKYFGKDVRKIVQYNNWARIATERLVDAYYSEKLHPSETRKKVIFYDGTRFLLSTFEYKLFGIGFINWSKNQAVESDFIMALINFGILGFIMFLIIPIIAFIKATIFILKNIKKIDLECYLLYMGLGIFFCISIIAGYTYIYVQFSIYLVLLMIMLQCKCDMLMLEKKPREIQKISFLLLHLGYGGIESASINSMNALSQKYQIELVLFYNLPVNQEKLLDKKITIKHLYNGAPNKEEFIDALRNKRILKIILEGIKSLDILFKKKYLIIKWLRKSQTDAIVSTRIEFNLLLGKYGSINTLKIAQEHHYHNNNRHYLRQIKKLENIDYLCALTKTLKQDYEKLLKNSTIKVILLPNMLFSMPKKNSTLANNLITVSRLVEGKRNDEIIRIFAKLKNQKAKLFIIGSGPLENELKILIKNLKLDDRVLLLGYLNKEQIEKYMIQSNLFLMASITEGLPMVLLEAMSYGVPCVAYETKSGVNDIIKNDYNGYVIKNRNENEYLEYLEFLLSDTKKVKKLSQGSIQTALAFSKEEVLKIWDKILEKN